MRPRSWRSEGSVEKKRVSCTFLSSTRQRLGLGGSRASSLPAPASVFSRRSRPEPPVSRDPDAMLASRGVGFIALTMQCENEEKHGTDGGSDIDAQMEAMAKMAQLQNAEGGHGGSVPPSRPLTGSAGSAKSRQSAAIKAMWVWVKALGPRRCPLGCAGLMRGLHSAQRGAGTLIAEPLRFAMLNRSTPSKSTRDFLGTPARAERVRRASGSSPFVASPELLTWNEDLHGTPPVGVARSFARLGGHTS
eukprot:g30068.t1